MEHAFQAALVGQQRAQTWLLSPTADFWGVCAGGGLVLVVLAIILHYGADAQISTADVLLGELHLGATYGVIARDRLWQRMPGDVWLVPALIIAATYALTYAGQAVVLTTIALYVGAWHRVRQNWGIARQYQWRHGGPLSSMHSRFFAAAIYSPMIAGVAYYTSTAESHEGDAYISLSLDPTILCLLGAIATLSVAAYFAFVLYNSSHVHRAEWWLVLANALAFGSAYVLGAWTLSFILVLALHHEVQYLCFTYASARRSARPIRRREEIRLLGSFALWPAIGLASWAVCKFADVEWLTPLLVAGLFCHYWLDGRIWTARARRLAAQKHT